MTFCTCTCSLSFLTQVQRALLSSCLWKCSLAFKALVLRVQNPALHSIPYYIYWITWKTPFPFHFINCNKKNCHREIRSANGSVACHNWLSLRPLVFSLRPNISFKPVRSTSKAHALPIPHSLYQCFLKQIDVYVGFQGDAHAWETLAGSFGWGRVNWRGDPWIPIKEDSPYSTN